MQYFQAKAITQIGHKHTFFVTDENDNVIDYQIIHPGFETLALKDLKTKYPEVTKHNNYLRIISRDNYWQIFGNIIKQRMIVKRGTHGQNKTS